MSAHNFWDNFSHGFMHGMFGNSPYSGCLGGWNMSFCNPFYNNMNLFMVPSVWSFANFYPLMPDIQIPYFGLSTLNMPFFEPIFDSSHFLMSSSSFINPSVDTSDFWKSSVFNNPIADTFTRQSTVVSPASSKGVSTDESKSISSASSKRVSTDESKSVSSASSKRVSTDESKSKSSAAKSSASETYKYNALISKYAKIYNLEETFLRAVISVESAFNPNAVSAVGAKGLMQLMPGTAKDMGVKNVFDPEENIRGGAKYLRKMLDRYHGNKRLALAAYNAGSGNVRNGQIPQNGQTPKYVKDVIKKYNEYKALA